MRFQAEHRFPGTVDDVVATLVDPAFHRALELPDLRLLEVVDHRDDEGCGLVLRYEFVGHLDPLVKRLLGGRRLTWRQALDVEAGGAGGRLTFALETDPDRLRGAATFAFAADGPAAVRRLDGTVRVNVPFIGAGAERRIVAGFLRRLDIEARELTDRLSS